MQPSLQIWLPYMFDWALDLKKGMLPRTPRKRVKKLSLLCWLCSLSFSSLSRHSQEELADVHSQEDDPEPDGDRSKAIGLELADTIRPLQQREHRLDPVAEVTELRELLGTPLCLKESTQLLLGREGAHTRVLLLLGMAGLTIRAGGASRLGEVAPARTVLVDSGLDWSKTTGALDYSLIVITKLSQAKARGSILPGQVRINVLLKG